MWKFNIITRHKDPTIKDHLERSGDYRGCVYALSWADIACFY